MWKALRRVSMTEVAYVLLLLVFATLGMFVYALAAESPLAGPLGAAIIVLMAASVVGFRLGARQRAKANEVGAPIPSENIWMPPRRRSQIERYLARYRSMRDNHEQLLQAVAEPGGDASTYPERRAA